MSKKYPGGFVTNLSPIDGNSVFFDGTGDSLTIPSPTPGFSFSTGEFTVEMWVYKTAARNDGLLDARAAPAAVPWFLGIDASNLPYFYDGAAYSSSIPVTLNAWSHVALVRTSGVLKIFVNGVQGYSAAYSVNLDRTAGLVIGDTVHGAAPLLGYISNLRIVKGTAVYTANFTPPTQLLNIPGTSLLTCNSPAIVDQSSNNFPITVTGNAAVSTLNPFPAVPYNPAPTSSSRTAPAPGVWTLDQAMQYTQQGVWPTADTYYIGLITSAGTAGDVIDTVAVDGSKNLYIGGYVNNSLSGLIKIAANGQLSFQKTAGAGNNTTGIVVDNVGNLYVSSYSISTGQAIIYKSDSLGSVAWARTLTAVGGTGTSLFFDVALDSAQENVYATGRAPVSGVNTFVLVKYNASGTLQWQTGLNPGDGARVRVGQDGFIYAINTTSGLIAKYNASGTLQSQITVADGGGGGLLDISIFIDASSNMYVSYGSGNSGVINKINSSGVIQWTRSLGTANQTIYRDVVVAASGNVYVTGWSTAPSSGSYNDFMIVKYDSNGTLQWQRRLNSGVTSVGNAITLDQQENVYVGGYRTFGSDDMFFAKLPADGSLTGTYSVGGVSVTYAATTLTAASRTTTIGSGTASSTTSYTSATGFQSLFDSSLTSSVATF